MERGFEVEKHGKNENYETGWRRRKYRTGSERLQIDTSENFNNEYKLKIMKNKKKKYEGISTAMKLNALNRNVLRTRGIVEMTKTDLCKAMFCQILMYDSENWILAKDIESKIQAAEMKYLQRIKRIQEDRVKSEVVREELNTGSLLKKTLK